MMNSDNIKPKKGNKFVDGHYKIKLEIPTKWKYEKLKGKIEILSGFSFESRFFDEKKGLPLIRIRDLAKDHTQTYYNGEYLDEFLIQKGDFLIGMDGEFKPYLWQGTKSLLNQRVCKITTKDPDELDLKFLFYAIRKELNYYELINIGTTVSHLSVFDIENIKIPTPSIQEQRKIGTTLSNIDELIQKQQQVIEQIQKLKKGQMQKLLTKGIGHTKFNKINFGSQIVESIPSDWNIKTLNEMSLNGTKSGYAVSTTDYGPGIAIVGMTDLFKNDILESDDLKTISLSRNMVKNFFVSEGDLLFARRSLTIEGAGKCVLVSKLVSPTIFESSIIQITLDSNKYLPRYVNYFLNSDLGIRIMTRIKQIVAVSGIKSSDLKIIKIPIPKVPQEQEKIVSILSNLDSLIQQEKQYKEKLENLKKGLMQQLLTGEKQIIV